MEKTKTRLEEYNGKFLPHCISDMFKDLDGKDIAEFLSSQGYKIIHHYNTGKNSVAITGNFYCVSSNGYVYRIK